MRAYTEELRTAIHEAGHAYVAYTLDVPVQLMSIVPDEDSRGHIWCDVAGPQALAQINVAGFVAVAMLLDEPLNLAMRGCSSDMHHAAQLTASTIMRKDEVDVLAPSWMLLGMIEKTANIIKVALNPVRQLAHFLMCHRELDQTCSTQALRHFIRDETMYCWKFCPCCGKALQKVTA